jgi:hypothetical protein
MSNASPAVTRISEPSASPELAAGAEQDRRERHHAERERMPHPAEHGDGNSAEHRQWSFDSDYGSIPAVSAEDHV